MLQTATSIPPRTAVATPSRIRATASLWSKDGDRPGTGERQGANGLSGLTMPVAALSYAEAARRATPAVVSIAAHNDGMAATVDDGNSDAPPASRRKPPRAYGDEEEDENPDDNMGSGVIATQDGYILTNHHVLGDGTQIEVILVSGERLKARLIGSDPDTDLAVLKVDRQNLPTIEFAHRNDIAVGDVVLAISNSGESDEIAVILPALKRKNITLIGMTGRPESTLARHADIHLTVAVPQEACPLGLAPTSSTTAALALGDALAVALLRARAFTRDDFALSHPAGSLGKRLLLQVADVMHSGDELPVVRLDTPFADLIVCMSEKGLGMVAVADEAGYLKGIFTDGDLRRLFQQQRDFSGLTAQAVMGAHPKTITPNRLATEALKTMQQNRVNGLPVCDEAGRLLGALNMHDLLKARIV